MTAAADPYLLLPLDGVHAIEASAGTGKTFTLATLVVRLVVEGGLKVGQILAVTFTEAATQELRSRIHRRLKIAEALVDADLDEDASPEAVLTHAVLARHLAGSKESARSLRQRLRAAADEIDLAAIFTIHGFCARVLREHALESGQAFDAPVLMTDDTRLREAIAADLWRANGIEPDAADDLLALWPGGPAKLAEDLRPLLRERELRPALVELPDDPLPLLHAAGSALAGAFRTHGDDFRASLRLAVEDKVLNGKSYGVDWINALFDALRAWSAAGDYDVPFQHPKLTHLHRDRLLEKTSKGSAGRTPDSPICDAVSAYIDALDEMAEWQDARRTILLHRLRDDARIRVNRFKQQQRVQTYDDLVDRVADAVDGHHADALVAQLRAEYRVALVDEFQDTDPRQWRIFERIFGLASGAPALFVIGDPKQAIYGFRGGDVETYLAAKESAQQAPALLSNFRSRPAVLRAIGALYAQAEASGTLPFVDARVHFRDVEPGGGRRDEDYLRDAAPAPALTLWLAPVSDQVDAKGKPKAHSAPRSRELATQGCVAAIHRVLSDARAGSATLLGCPVQPGDLAVLVRTHSEATRIRQALAMVGIPAVAAGKQSLFETHEARDLHALLLALLHGADDGRLRTALSTVLIGVDATQVAGLDEDGEALRVWQLSALAWRERLQHGGPLALVTDLCAEHASRVLGLLDGERRLTNYLQLAELLQEAQAHAPGLHALVDWLARAIASASSDDETQLLRLESDARRVQIVTLHKSKGLEYPLVFLPFAGIGRTSRSPGRHVTVTDDAGRALHWDLLRSTSGWDDAKLRWIDAQRAEDARLLYVGLTRTRDALWLAGGRFYQHDKSPLAQMIADPVALASAPGGPILVDHSLPVDALPWMPPAAQATVHPARIATRSPASDWWVYSFTQLSHAEAGNETAGAATAADEGGQDEPAAPAIESEPGAAVADARFSGTRFGVVLHHALEQTDFSAWRDWGDGDAVPAGETALITNALLAGGYSADEVEDGVALLGGLMGHTLSVILPEQLRLCDLPAESRRAEIEFHFSLAATSVERLLELLHAHGVADERRGFGLRRRLEGLMTGKIDLTYRHAGRWYVLDYKSNRLSGYGPLLLAQAMAENEYDLQALIYTVALHRWLRFRLGSAYDYARDYGGIRYVFCRGLDAGRTDSPGVHAQRFAPALVEALDVLFAGGDAQHAAMLARAEGGA